MTVGGPPPDRHRDEGGVDTGYRVDLFVRSFAPTGAHARQREVVERLESLAGAGRIGTFSCTVWGNRIHPETAAKFGPGRAALATVERFRAWATDHDASVDSFFEEREMRSTFEEMSIRVIVPPVFCIAVSDGDGIWGVFPCSHGGETFTVTDGLDLLDTGGVPPDPFEERVSIRS